MGLTSTSVATTVEDATTNSTWSGSEVTGSSAYDTSTVNGEVGSIAPTGTVSYTYWTDADCGVSESAAGTSAGSDLSLGTQSSTEGPLPDGSYSFQATYSGDTNYSGSTSPCESFSVGLTSTSVATTVEDATTNSTWSGSEVTGSSAYDTSTVNGEVGSIAPTGTVSYTYWTDADCGVSESAAGTSAGSNLSLGTQSSTEGPLPEGTYSFQATYSGDANYSGSTSPCESFSVGTASTSTTSTPTSSSLALGSSNTDGATVTAFGGGVDPTGPVTFYECGPTVSAQPCTSSSWTQFDTESLSGSSNPDTVTSAPFTPDATGTWCFAAVYSGDGNYTGSSDQGTDECFTVTGVASSTTSSPSSSTAALDGPNSDNVVVTGADGASNAPYPTGHVTFYTCPEGVDPCTSANWTQLGSTVTLSTGEVNTNSATSADFTNDATGTWCFAAVYSGDGNYGGSSDQTSHECYTVAQASTTTISAPLNTTITEGQSNIDQATVYGNDADSSPPPPTGTVTFYQCGPTTTPTACTGGTQVGHPVNLTTSGSNTAAANSSAFTPAASPTAIGYWCFRAAYSGDGNYFTSSDDSSTNECFYVSGPLTITTASPLPQGTEHVHYSDQLQAVGRDGSLYLEQERRPAPRHHPELLGPLVGDPDSVPVPSPLRPRSTTPPSPSTRRPPSHCPSPSRNDRNFQDRRRGSRTRWPRRLAAAPGVAFVTRSMSAGWTTLATARQDPDLRCCKQRLTAHGVHRLLGVLGAGVDPDLPSLPSVKVPWVATSLRQWRGPYRTPAPRERRASGEAGQIGACRGHTGIPHNHNE